MLVAANCGSFLFVIVAVKREVGAAEVFSHHRVFVCMLWLGRILVAPVAAR
jgi:hypothetical protein